MTISISTHELVRRLSSPILAATGFCVFNLGQAAPAGIVDLLIDTEFQGGLQVRDRQDQPVEIRWNDAKGKPWWHVAQHHSASNVADAAFQTISAGRFDFRDERQCLSIHPEGMEADVIMSVNAFNEYEGRLRAKGDPWPHLYLNQRISSPDGHLGAKAPTLAEMDRIEFGLQIKLLFNERHVAAGFDPRVHTAQFLFFLTVVNSNPSSRGHGDYYWFGILLFDDRYPLTTRKVQLDAGSPKKPATGKLIYNVGLSSFTDRVVADGEWVEVHGDLLPHIKAGLAEAWKRGYLGDSHNEADYRLGRCVIGWEVPGLNDAAMAVRGLSCRAQRKP